MIVKEVSEIPLESQRAMPYIDNIFYSIYLAVYTKTETSCMIP